MRTGESWPSPATNAYSSGSLACRVGLLATKSSESAIGSASDRLALTSAMLIAVSLLKKSQDAM